MPGTRKLGRTTDSRNAMLRAMVTYLFENGKIETTVTRAKERMSPRRSSTSTAPNMPTATAVTPASTRSAPAAAMPPRWPSWSWSDQP